MTVDDLIGSINKNSTLGDLRPLVGVLDEYLTQGGKVYDVSPITGQTPLEAAVAAKNPFIVNELLIKGGFDTLEVRAMLTESGNKIITSPLEHAIENLNPIIIVMLMGALPSQKLVCHWSQLALNKINKLNVSGTEIDILKMLMGNNIKSALAIPPALVLPTINENDNTTNSVSTSSSSAPAPILPAYQGVVEKASSPIPERVTLLMLEKEIGEDNTVKDENQKETPKFRLLLDKYLDQGEDINAIGTNGLTLLTRLVRPGLRDQYARIEQLKYLLTKLQVKDLKRQDGNYETALEMARRLQYGRLETFFTRFMEDAEKLSLEDRDTTPLKKLPSYLNVQVELCGAQADLPRFVDPKKVDPNKTSAANTMGISLVDANTRKEFSRGFF